MNADVGYERSAMTLAELAKTLPNGFHDAYLTSINMDYAKGELRLGMSLSFAAPDDPPDVPGYRSALVTVTGVRLFVVDPPSADPNYSVLECDEQPADGFVTSTSELWNQAMDQKLIDAAGPNAPLYSFFMGTWNSCIHIAATDAVCVWKDECTPSEAVH